MNIKVNISFLIIKVNTDDEVVLVFKLLDHFIHKIYHQAKKNDNVIIFILCVHEIIGVIREAIQVNGTWSISSSYCSKELNAGYQLNLLIYH